MPVPERDKDPDDPGEQNPKREDPGAPLPIGEPARPPREEAGHRQK